MNLKSMFRFIRLSIGKFIIDRSPILSHQNNLKKILFLRNDGKIGDYIVSSFVFREIKKQLPHCHIGVVCSYNNLYLFENNPYIDQCYVVKKRKIKDYISCAKQLKKEQYDVVIDPTVMLRNRDLLFLRLISAKCYIGYQKQNYRLFNFNIPIKHQHFSEIYRSALTLIGLKNINTRYEVPENRQSEADVQQFLKENQLKDYIAVNFFGAGSARQFNPEKMRALLEYLTSKTILPIVLLTFPDVTAKVCELAQHYPNVFVYSQTSTIFDTIALIKYAKVIISPDTSIVHIAVGFNKPIIAFYSQDEENFVHWQPNTANAHILRFNNSVNEIDLTLIEECWL